MTIVILNIILIVITVCILLLLVYQYGKRMFFDISIIYTVVILLVPLMFFFTNLIYTIIFNKSHGVGWTFIPLLIPIVYFIISKIQEKIRGSLYRKSKQLIASPIIELAMQDNLIIKNQDIRIRIRNKNRIDFIINVYSESEKKILADLINKHEENLKSKIINQKIRFIFDEKKSKNPLITNKTCSQI
ncbi:hypothetical protein EXW28_18265 [Bacillus mycoides]|uniref:hypothetical protein n=1 Tax=Bacillus mycoides TaxID=1405 RepID=UPI001C010215|nr:hypothetical protein [Bacillus mycoides]QWG51685.1 hypothetical protein EXW37_18260 [Bacillus mycoides]QWH35488.1 hypothetical protein EXW28_18265 [Bacillus mycoides]